MKNPALLLALFASMAFTGAHAQTDTTKIYTTKNEIKLGAVKLLAGGIMDVTYEYIHSDYFTYGASALVNFDHGNTYEEDFSLTPFVRFYFTEPRKYGAIGFFVEGFGKFINGRKYQEYYVYYNDNGTYVEDWQRNRKSYTTGGVGLSLGWKWINHTGFVFEVLCGVGRNFGSGDNVPSASFRGDLNLGYRF